jgi:hypothetical protein
MDRRHLRREESRRAIAEAIDRLKSGNATHPRHVGIRVRITKEAVAREARVSVATLYRSADLISEINSFATELIGQKIRPAEERRKKLLAEIDDLKTCLEALLAENYRLMELLAAYDPTLGEVSPIRLDVERKLRLSAPG